MPRVSRASTAAALLSSCLLLVSACAADEATESANTVPESSPVEAAAFSGVESVDHIIVAIDSLERGIALLEEATGVRAEFGGVHPGRGTQNALISLGPRTYMELIAPNPEDEAGPETVLEYAGFRELTPAGLAAGSMDVDADNDRFMASGLPDGAVAPGSRVTLDGDTLSWKTIAPWPSGVDWVLPFFIEWVVPTPHPATTTPTGCTLAGVMAITPNADTVRTLFGKAGLMIGVESGDESSYRFELDCPTGRVVIG